MRFAKREMGVPGDAEFRNLLEMVLVAAIAAVPALCQSRLAPASLEKATQGLSVLGLLYSRLTYLRKRAFCKNFQGVFRDAGLVESEENGPTLFKKEKTEVIAGIDAAIKAQKRSSNRGAARGASRYPRRPYYPRGGFSSYSRNYSPQQPPQAQPFFPYPQQFPPPGYPYQDQQGFYPPNPYGNPNRGRGRPFRGRGRGARGNPEYQK